MNAIALQFLRDATWDWIAQARPDCKEDADVPCHPDTIADAAQQPYPDLFDLAYGRDCIAGHPSSSSLSESRHKQVS